MCIVIDPPVFISLLKIDDAEHEKFKPVFDWVVNGSGKFVTGGSKYKNELKKMSSILVILAELKKKGKIVSIDDGTVDFEVDVVKGIEPAKNFDDPHLVALIRLTNCKLVCTRDIRALPYLRSGKFYSSLSQRPKIYTRKKNTGLLCSKNIAKCCR